MDVDEAVERHVGEMLARSCELRASGPPKCGTEYLYLAEAKSHRGDRRPRRQLEREAYLEEVERWCDAERRDRGRDAFSLPREAGHVPFLPEAEMASLTASAAKLRGAMLAVRRRLLSLYEGADKEAAGALIWQGIANEIEALVARGPTESERFWRQRQFDQVAAMTEGNRR